MKPRPFIPGRKLPNALPPVLGITTVLGHCGRPVLVQAGRGAYIGGERWGDYSATCTDPGDDSFWTVQEFSSRAYEDDGNPYKIWATWIGQIRVLP